VIPYGSLLKGTWKGRKKWERIKGKEGRDGGEGRVQLSTHLTNIRSRKPESSYHCDI